MCKWYRDHMGWADMGLVSQHISVVDTHIHIDNLGPQCTPVHSLNHKPEFSFSANKYEHKSDSTWIDSKSIANPPTGQPHHLKIYWWTCNCIWLGNQSGQTSADGVTSSVGWASCAGSTWAWITRVRSRTLNFRTWVRNKTFWALTKWSSFL